MFLFCTHISGLYLHVLSILFARFSEMSKTFTVYGVQLQLLLLLSLTTTPPTLLCFD